MQWHTLKKSILVFLVVISKNKNDPNGTGYLEQGYTYELFKK
jgi:hypothetical protein